jgi:hypothetical protein
MRVGVAHTRSIPDHTRFAPGHSRRLPSSQRKLGYQRVTSVICPEEYPSFHWGDGTAQSGNGMGQRG